MRRRAQDGQCQTHNRWGNAVQTDGDDGVLGVGPRSGLRQRSAIGQVLAVGAHLEGHPALGPRDGPLKSLDEPAGLIQARLGLNREKPYPLLAEGLEARQVDRLEVGGVSGIRAGVLGSVRQVGAIGAEAARHEHGLLRVGLHMQITSVEGQTCGSRDHGAGIRLGEAGAHEGGSSGLIGIRADDSGAGEEIVCVNSGDGLWRLGQGEGGPQRVRRADSPGIEFGAHGAVQDDGAACHQLGQVDLVLRGIGRGRKGSHGDTLTEASAEHR